MSLQNAGNAQPAARRAGLAIVGARKLLEMANIATIASTSAGFSGGARIASYVSFVHPGNVRRGFAVCGVNFARKVDRVKSTRDDDYGLVQYGRATSPGNKARREVRIGHRPTTSGTETSSIFTMAASLRMDMTPSSSTILDGGIRYARRVTSTKGCHFWIWPTDDILR